MNGCSYLYFNLAVYRSSNLSIYLSKYLSVYLSIYLFLYLSLHLSDDGLDEWIMPGINAQSILQVFLILISLLVTCTIFHRKGINIHRDIFIYSVFYISLYIQCTVYKLCQEGVVNLRTYIYPWSMVFIQTIQS